MLQQQTNIPAYVAGMRKYWVIDPYAVIISAEIRLLADRLAIVIIQDPAQHLSALDDTCFLRSLRWDRGLLPNPLVWAGFIVVAGVLPHDAP
jgi:hypothetical protein